MEKGLVVLLDALGVKGIWARKEPDSVALSWNRIVNDFHEASRRMEKKIKGAGFKDSKSNVAAFSDTVIVTIIDVDPPAFLPLLGELLMPPFIGALMNGFLLRGGLGSDQTN